METFTLLNPAIPPATLESGVVCNHYFTRFLEI